MSAAVYQSLRGLEDLECGLNRLCRSQLMRIPEFKQMYGAIERHHKDVQLAHLTGKAKDQQSKAERDTTFYNILVRMLCEIKERRTGDQKECLRQVHTWYMSNRHALYCGPHFGKEYLKEEAKDILLKSTTLKHLVHIKSPKEHLVNQKVTQTQTGRISSANFQKSVISPEDFTPYTNLSRQADKDQMPTSFLSDPVLPSDSEPVSRAATNSPEFGDVNLDLQFDPSKKSMMLNQYLNPSAEIFLSHSPHRAMMRPKSATTVTFSPLKEQSSNLPTSVTTIKSMVHPISSLVNPHTVLATILSHTASGEIAGKPCIPRQAMSAKFSRSENLQAWQTFNKKRSYGQDVISKLNFVGRSGTAADIRYSAHGHGQSPEAYTEDFVKHYTRRANSVSKDLPDQENIFVYQTLEDFYQTTENIRPISSKASRMSSFARVNSAASVTQRGNRTASQTPSSDKMTKHMPNMSQPFEQLDDWLGQEEDVMPEDDTGINLDTMMNAIDSVTDSMTYYKEKLIPEPQHGFRQPSTTGLPTPKEVNSSYDYDVSSDCACSTSVGIHLNENEASRPFSSPLASSTVTVRSDTPHELKKAKITCSSSGIVDWRGRIQPETIRYKWSKTSFGGHTYLKKWYRPNHRSAGSASGGGRPKTAPITAKEKWKTQQPSDKNARVIQAASHNTTVVNQHDVDSLMQVQHLLSSEDKTPCMDLVNCEEATLKKVRKSTKETPVLEYLSFVIPSATISVEQKCTENSGKVDDNDEIDRASSSEDVDPHQTQDTTDEVLQTLYDEDALNAAIREDLENLTRDYRLLSPTTEAESLADMPGSRDTNSVPVQSFSHPHDYKLRKGPALNTSASALIPKMRLVKPKSRNAQEDCHIKKAKNLAMFMNKVERSRSMDNPCYSSLSTAASVDSLIGTSLQVFKLSVSSKGRSSHILTEDDIGAMDDQGIFSVLSCTKQTFEAELKAACRMSLEVEIMAQDQIELQDLILLYVLVGVKRAAPSVGHTAGFDQPQDILLHKETVSKSASSKQIDGQGLKDAQHTFSIRSITKIGRPIAQVSHIPDPDELLQAVQIKKEAAAAVDIQRIFRGYVARNVYRSLLSEERQKREEARRAAVRIQRMYRSHLTRTDAIYSREDLKPELVQWSKDVKEIQSENAVKRQAKKASWTDKMSSNIKATKNRIAFIGPHVEIYSIYHPKKTGPSKYKLNMAAVKIQKVVRGWILRRKLKKLFVKAKWHGSNFYKLAKEYKAMLKRVQRQHGVDKPKTPFSLKDFNNYMDLRRRYESIFEKKSFNGELEKGALEAFFKGCDLYPSQAEIEEAVDVTMHGHANRRGNLGLTKKELMDIIFYIYVPPAAGLQGTRRSTWMNPIIDGQEARKLLGSEFVEQAPLAPCMKLVIESKLQQHQREQAQKNTDERRRIQEVEKRILEERQTTHKSSKKVTIQKPEDKIS